MNKTKSMKLPQKPQLEVIVKYEAATPENARMMVKLFAEMLRLYVDKRKAIKSGEISLLK